MPPGIIDHQWSFLGEKMKKTLLFIALSLSFISACNEQEKQRNSATDYVVTKNSSNADPYVAANKIAVSDDEISCDPNSKEEQCALIPISDCFGCFDANGSGQRAVNLATAKNIMSSKVEECKGKFEEKQKNKEQPKMAEHGSCKHNWAVCSKESVCVGTTLNEKDFKAKMEIVKQHMESMKNAQPQS